MPEQKPNRKKVQAAPTKYVILKRIEGADLGDVGEAWCQVAIVTARSKTLALNGMGDGNLGTFKAVAESAWKGGVTRAQTSLVTSTPLGEE